MSHDDIRHEVDARRWQVLGNQTVVPHTGAVSPEGLRWSAVWETGRGITALDGVTALHAAGLEHYADEAIHVSYGFKWLRHLLGDDNAGQEELKRLTDEAREVMAQYVKAHGNDPDISLAPYFDRLYDLVATMTFEIPDDGLEIHWAPVVADEAVLEEL